MLTINDRLAGEAITFHCVQSTRDVAEYKDFIDTHRWLALDTESTGLNPFHPQWRLRTFQCGDSNTAYVVPARFHDLIEWTMAQPMHWIGHNGPHDMRCLAVHLGQCNVDCDGETHIPGHYRDPRGQQDGGVGHGLKDLAVSLVDPTAGRWEVELKRIFKTIEIPLPGEVYKSGARKGQPKVRKAKLSEGWSLIDPMNPAYIAYAAADPILTHRVWRLLQPETAYYLKLYRFDKRLQEIADKLNRRGMLIDLPYTMHLSEEYTKGAERAQEVALAHGCHNVQSGQQIAEVLAQYGIESPEVTKTGLPKMDARILRALAVAYAADPAVSEFLGAVLVAKQLSKRREAYSDAFLREADTAHRIHPSINILAAVTGRMSVSNPALQQLPTKDREDELVSD